MLTNRQSLSLAQILYGAEWQISIVDDFKYTLSYWRGRKEKEKKVMIVGRFNKRGYTPTVTSLYMLNQCRISLDDGSRRPKTNGYGERGGRQGLEERMDP